MADTKLYYKATHKIIDEELRAYILKIYNHMCLALIITALSAFITITLKPIAQFLFITTQNGELLGLTGPAILIIFLPFFISLYMSWMLPTLSINESRTLLWIYSACMGLSLAPIALIYTNTSIARTFFICAGAFGCMSLYGYTTKRDLTSAGSFFIMGIFGLIISSLTNIFLRSPAIYYAESFIGIVIFMGLMAWDTQKIKMIYYNYNTNGGELGDKISIIAALTLYLDILNLFIYLLRFLGRKKRKN